MSSHRGIDQLPAIAPAGSHATVAPDGQPDVVPVGYEFDAMYLYVGGMNPARLRSSKA
jgi:pyridoxamine 5'-phosphate oxidase family protein